MSKEKDEVELTEWEQMWEQMERNMMITFTKMQQESEKNIREMFAKMTLDMNKRSVNNKIKTAEIKPEDEVKSAIVEAVVISAPLIVDEVEILEIPAGFAEVIAVEKNKAIYDVLKTYRSNLVKPSFTACGESISNMLKVFYAFLFDGINGLMSFEIGVECFIFDPGGMCKEFKDFSRLGLSLRALDICCLTNRF